MDTKDLNAVIAFMQRAENLKNTIRSAHTSTGRDESCAEHSWRLCLLALVLVHEYQGADPAKVLSFAIIHDLAEAVCGDTPAIYQENTEDKALKEHKVIQELCACLPLNVRDHMLALWEEYEKGESLEAKLVKGLDKLETIMQHNQGKNPTNFDYAFNLEYGRKYTEKLPLLRQLRDLIDNTTKQRCQEQKVEQ